MDAVRPVHENTGIPTIVPQQLPSSPDLIKVLIRWKWLPILGAAIGATLGYLYYGQEPPQYKAVARIQVVSPGKEIPIPTFENRVDQRSRGDELVVIQSAAVLRSAVDIGRLTQHRKLNNMSAEQIVQMLQGPKILDLRLGSKDVNSDIINIGVTTNDAELSSEIAEAVVSGYEDFVSRKFRTYSQDAVAALTKFSDIYEKRRASAKSELDKIRLNTNLLWVDNKPYDPVADKILKSNQEILAIEVKMKNAEAVLQQIQKGQEAGRSAEELLRMASTSMTDSGFRMYDEASGVPNIKDASQAIYNQADSYETERVVPLRAELEFLNQQNLGELHPTVMSVKQRLEKSEQELLRRREKAKQMEEAFQKEYGSTIKDTPTMGSKLLAVQGALQIYLAKLTYEKNQYKTEVDSLKIKLQENQATISSYLINLADLEAVSEVASQIGESLRKLTMGTEYGQKTVTRLELPSIGTLVGPFLIRYVGIGALIGFVVFGGLAYLLELADRSYRNPEEIAADLGMPIIGHLPLATISRSDRIDEKVDSSIVTLHKNRSSLAEAFRGVRTAVFFGSQQGNVKVIQVTSPVPGDGKSTVAANLAVSIAQSGRRVCLIDCDFRRPRVAKMFGLREDVGLAQVIGGKAELDEAIQSTSIENMSSLTCGRRPGNPSELLSSEAFPEIISELRNRFDFIIIDTPPMLVVSDPANVATHVDGVVLTIRLRRNLKPIATRAAQMLHSINANMIGVVVNGIGVGGNGYGYGGYRYDNYSGGRGSGYGHSGYGGYGYGSTFQYGGYYGGSVVGRDYYDEQAPKLSSKNVEVKS